MRARTILVAEDDASVRELVRTRLQLSGYDVLTARTGGEALSRVRNLLVDGVVLDINMPEVDGFEVLKAMQRTPAISRLPVLMLTARHAEQDVRRALVLGARDYLTKPFSEQQLVARVARMLRTPFGPPASPAPA
jgi:DNA-binding response OmpR family regulator